MKLIEPICERLASFECTVYDYVIHYVDLLFIILIGLIFLIMVIGILIWIYLSSYWLYKKFTKE